MKLISKVTLQYGTEVNVNYSGPYYDNKNHSDNQEDYSLRTNESYFYTIHYNSFDRRVVKVYNDYFYYYFSFDTVHNYFYTQNESRELKLKKIIKSLL